MDELEVKLENLDKLFDEAHKLDSANDEIQNEIVEDNNDIVTLTDKNKVGTINNSWIGELYQKDEVNEKTIKDDAIGLVSDMDRKQLEDNNSLIVDKTSNNKLMELPSNLLPTIKQDSHALVVQKTKTLSLMKKAGIVFPSILVTIVTLTVGVIIAAIFLTK